MANDRLIYAETLKEAWRKKHNIGEDDCGAVFVGYTEIPMLIDEQPTVDAVEVVRCKDCKYSVDYYNDGDCYCRRPEREMVWIGQKWDFFCAAGRRRTSDDQ